MILILSLLRIVEKMGRGKSVQLNCWNSKRSFFAIFILVAVSVPLFQSNFSLCHIHSSADRFSTQNELSARLISSIPSSHNPRRSIT